MNRQDARSESLGWALAAFAIGMGFLALDRAIALVDAVEVPWSREYGALLGLVAESCGAPHSLDGGSAAWNDCKPWTRTIVRRDARDPLEQRVVYRLTRAQARRLGRLGGDLSANLARAELVSRSNDPRLNFLAVNLADEFFKGRISEAVARAKFDRLAGLAASGKESPCLRELLFKPASAPLAPPRFRFWPPMASARVEGARS